VQQPTERRHGAAVFGQAASTLPPTSQPEAETIVECRWGLVHDGRQRPLRPTKAPEPGPDSL